MKDKMTTAKIVQVLAALTSGVFVYQAAFGVWEPQISRGIYILSAMLLAFLMNPARKKDRVVPVWMKVTDYLLAGLSIFCILWFMFNFEHLALAAGLPLDTIHVVVGIIMIILVLESCRRTIGPALPIIVSLFLLYNYYGPMMPGPLRHRGFSVNRIVSVMFAGTEGIFGSVVFIFATHIFLFVIFGAFLQKSGAGQFFIDLSKAVAGKVAGGAGQASVVSSWILGSIMGSSTANTAVTGAVTIPLMIDNGYRKHVAAAIEAVVSIGGQFMPPIMGASAFLMAAIVGVPYIEVALAGLIPAVLFFLSMVLMVFLEAKRTNIAPLPESEIPKVSEVFKKGWFYLIPIIIIVYILARGYSPSRAGVYAIVACFGLSWLNKERRMGPKEIYEALADGAKGALSISATAGPIGMLIAAISLPGLGMRISTIIIQLSGGHLPLALLLVMAASFILGMGMNVSSAYLLLATLTAPALVDLGVPILAAHFFVFWTSQLSVVTPPVCLSAFVAASLAGADVWKTGWYSLRMGLIIYYMPVLFVMMPGLMFMGTGAEIIYAIACTIIGVVAFSVFMQGYLLTTLTLVERVLIGVASLMVIHIDWISDIIGLTLLVFAVVSQVVRARKGAQPPSAAGV